MFVNSSAFRPRVGLLICNKFTNSYKAAEKVLEEILKVNFKGNLLEVVYVIYAPTDVANDSDKEAFFNDLHENLSKEQPHSVVVVPGDFNGCTGLDSHQQNSLIIGRYTYHNSINNNGNRQVDLCSQTRM